MISLQEALDAIAARPICLPAEAVPLSAACGRLLVQPLYASLDQPPFDKAAMDGWLWLGRKEQRLVADRDSLDALRNGAGKEAGDAVSR